MFYSEHRPAGGREKNHWSIIIGQFSFIIMETTTHVGGISISAYPELPYLLARRAHEAGHL